MDQQEFQWDSAVIHAEAAKRGLSRLQAAVLQWLHANGEHNHFWGELDGENQRIFLSRVTTSKYALADSLKKSPSGVYEALRSLRSRGVLGTESRPSGTLIVVCWNRLRAMQEWGDAARSDATETGGVVGRSRRQSAVVGGSLNPSVSEGVSEQSNNHSLTHSGDRLPPTTADCGPGEDQEKSPPVDLDRFPGFPTDAFAQISAVQLYQRLGAWWTEWQMSDKGYDPNQVVGAILATRHKERTSPEQYARAVLRKGVAVHWCREAERWRDRQQAELRRSQGVGGGT